MTETEQRAAAGDGNRTDHAGAGRIVRMHELLRLTGMSRSGVYRAMKAGAFPARVAIGVRAVGWRHDEVMRWINGRRRR